MEVLLTSICILTKKKKGTYPDNAKCVTFGFHAILDHLFEHETQCPMCMPDTSQLTSQVTLLLLFFQPMYLEALCIIKSRRFILLGISSGFRDLILAAADVCCEAACSILLITEGPKPRTDSKAPGHQKGGVQSSERHRNPAAIIHSGMV